jgi:prepilin-type N-terminal cleavage/methylation domain-containing protein
MDRPPLNAQPGPALGEDHGFTLIEVLVASLILVVGMLGVLTCITQAQATTWSTQARTNANALVREVIEEAHSVPYDQLVTSTLVAALKARPGLSDDQLGTSGWQVRRGGFTYTLSIGACTIDDPRDGTGNHDPGVFCASGATGTTPAQCNNLLSVNALVGSVCVGACAAGGVDANPADAKRIVVLVRWDRGEGSRYVLQGATIANPGLAAAPAVTSISSPTTIPVTDPSVTSLQVDGTTSVTAATVAAYLDGTSQGSATGSGTSWSFAWPLGTVSGSTKPGPGQVVDGSYLIGLKAFDANGQFGQSRTLTVVVNRSAPYPPQSLRAGRNGATVELDWLPAPERDVELYRGYRSNGASWILVCETTAVTCQDPAPPAFGTPTYTVVAVDRNAAGALREGAQATAATVPLLNNPPYAPTNLAATSSSGTTTLTWTAPAGGDPDLGDAVDHYAIYRDGTLYENRYDRTPDATTTTWTDTQTGGQVHTYAVCAVDTHLAESGKLGPVTK